MKKIYLLILAVLFSTCSFSQEKYFLDENPLFHQYFRNRMIDFQVGKVLEEYTIYYHDIDKNEIDYGDGTTLSKTIFEFKKGKIIEIRSIDMDPEGERVFYIEKLEYSENQIAHAVGKPGNNLYRTEYIIDNSDEGQIYRCITQGGPKTVFKVSQYGLAMWRNYNDFLAGDRTKYDYDRVDDKIYYSFYNHYQENIGQEAIYTNGLLTEYYQYYDEYHDVYTVTEGTGSILRYDLEGNLIRESELERTLDEHGFLIYQRVRHPDKRGYEYFAEMQY